MTPSWSRKGRHSRFLHTPTSNTRAVLTASYDLIPKVFHRTSGKHDQGGCLILVGKSGSRRAGVREALGWRLPSFETRNVQPCDEGRKRSDWGLGFRTMHPGFPSAFHAHRNVVSVCGPESSRRIWPLVPGTRHEPRRLLRTQFLILLFLFIGSWVHRSSRTSGEEDEEKSLTNRLQFPDTVPNPMRLTRYTTWKLVPKGERS